MSIHFAYPNVLPKKGDFIGCGRYTVFAPDDAPPSRYNEVQDAPNQITKRLYILAAFLLVGFSMIWLLPKSSDMKLSCLARNLPMKFDSMRGESTAVTGKELDILAKDTEFERAQYVNVDEPTHPPVEVSIVFSGKDLNNSIHRPERCLKAQGWNFERERKVMVKGAMPDGSDMPFREIVCSKPVRENSLGQD